MMLCKNENLTKRKNNNMLKFYCTTCKFIYALIF